MKSIILFGKGPSVSKCTKEIVGKYDDVAIVNYPLLNPFFTSLIADKKIKYQFSYCSVNLTSTTLIIQASYLLNSYFYNLYL